MLAGLVGLGVLFAALAVVTAVGVGRLLASLGSGTPSGTLIFLLVVAALGMGWARFAERRHGERIGQHYVAQLRGELVRRALDPGSRVSAGVTMARLTNDLSGLRVWIAQGIVPLVSAGPLILGALGVFFVISPALGLAVAGVLVLLGVAILLLSDRLFERSREVRRRRGRLAALVADTLAAAPTIRAGGGADREAARIERAGRSVAEGAVERASASGVVRGIAVGIGAFISVLVVVGGSLLGLEVATVGTALTMAGLLATPLADLGRCVEYRQNQRAAARILGPALAAPPVSRPAPVDTPAATAGAVTLPGGVVLRPGERLVVDPADRLADVIRAAAQGDTVGGPGVVVDGAALAWLPDAERRERVGVATAHQPWERGPLLRAVRYRHPDARDYRTAVWMRRVGFDAVVDALPEGDATRLQRGGAPLTSPQRALLALTRAVAGDPALLVLDRLDEQLDAAGAEALRDLVAEYPGVVVLITRDGTATDVPRAWPTTATLELPEDAVEDATERLDLLPSADSAAEPPASRPLPPPVRALRR